jgi:4-amino-4-deoxy-L-arabinose transferase-like glycosyltransferase
MRPCLLSIRFWSGVSVLLGVVMLWLHSMQETRVLTLQRGYGTRIFRLTHESGAVEAYYQFSRGGVTYYPGYGRGEGPWKLSSAAPPVPLEMRWMPLAQVRLDGRILKPVTQGQRLRVPYWMMMLALLWVWLPLLAWRWIRQRRLAAAMAMPEDREG